MRPPYLKVFGNNGPKRPFFLLFFLSAFGVVSIKIKIKPGVVLLVVLWFFLSFLLCGVVRASCAMRFISRRSAARARAQSVSASRCLSCLGAEVLPGCQEDAGDLHYTVPGCCYAGRQYRVKLGESEDYRMHECIKGGPDRVRGLVMQCGLALSWTVIVFCFSPYRTNLDTYLILIS